MSDEPRQEGGISLWGDAFVAKIDFQPALQGATELNRAVDLLGAKIDSVVARATNRLAQLGTAMRGAAASTAAAGGGVSLFSDGRGSTSVGRARADGGNIRNPAPALGMTGESGGSRPVARPPITPDASPRMTTARPGSTPAQDGVDFRGSARTRFAPHEVEIIPPGRDVISPFGGSPDPRQFRQPYNYVPRSRGQYRPANTAYSEWLAATDFQRGPRTVNPRGTPALGWGDPWIAGQFSRSTDLVHVPRRGRAETPFTDDVGWRYRGPPPDPNWGRWQGELVHVPWRSPDRQTPHQMPRAWRDANYFVEGSGRMAGRAGAAMRGLSPQRLMAAASSVYLAQTLAGIGGYVMQSTIGEAAEEQEARVLLSNALQSPAMGIDRGQATAFADSLVEARYMSGLATSAAGLGLSRTELADQYKHLAPIIRLTAENANEFQSGLQKGSLAKQLLLARDPAQGNRGAMVALSELYAGGPDRFRSLSLRFELPRNRLKEIEQEMQAKGGVADPGDIVIQMLEEMGFGTSYLERRANETLPGQMGRTGALWANFKIDAFQGALATVIEDLDRLNDSVEAWAKSPAYDVFISRVDTAMSRIFGVVTGPMANMIGGDMISGGGTYDPFALSQDINSFARRTPGGFKDADGNLISAAEALREAAETVTRSNTGGYLDAARYNPGRAAAMNSLLWGGSILGGGALLNRFAFNGQLGVAIRQAFSGVPGSVADGFKTAGAGFAAGLGPLILGTAAVGTTAANTVEANRVRQGVERMREGGHGVAQFSWADRSRWFNPAGGIGGAYYRAGRHLTRYGRAGDIIGTGLMGLGNTFSGALDAWGMAPWDYKTPLELEAEHIGDTDLTQRLAQQAVLALGPDNATPDQIRRYMLGEITTLEQERGTDILDARQTRAALDYGATQNPHRIGSEALLGAVIQGHANFGRGLTIGGKTYFTGDESGEFADEAAQLGVYQDVMADWGTSEEELYPILLRMWNELGRIGDNTEEAAESLSIRVSRIQLSEMDGLFYGYETNPDYRRSGVSDYRRPEKDLPLIPTPGVAPEWDNYGMYDAPGMALDHMQVSATTMTPNALYDAKTVAMYPHLKGVRHAGWDFTIGQRGVGGEAIKSPFSLGTVKGVGEDASYGNYIQVQTATGRVWQFSHLDRLPDFQAGDRILQNMILGHEGSTGTSSGPHLDLKLVNPDTLNPRERVQENYDPELLERLWFEDLNAVPAGGSAQGSTINITVGDVVVGSSVAGTPEEITDEVLARLTAALKPELMRQLTRDGDLDNAIGHVQQNRLRKGRTDGIA